MKTRIENEILRDDIDSAISDAIITALRFYRREKLFFNQGSSTVTAITNTTTTALPTDFQSPITARIQITTGQYNPLELANYSWIEERYLTDSFKGEPSFYAIFNDLIYWWLIPQQNYTVYLSYVKRLTEPSANSDTSAWFTYGESLIRNHAKAVLFADVLFAPDKAAAHFSLAERELLNLRRESAGRNFNTSIIPSL